MTIVEQNHKIEITELGELLMIGLPVNVSFKNGDFSKIEQTKEEFKRRLSEIPNAVNPVEYYAPWYSSEVMFTYLYCLQVSSLEFIPEGMIGLTIPAHQYVLVSYDGVRPFEPDPYEVIHRYSDEHGLKKNEPAMILEKYLFENDDREGKIVIDVYAPIQ
ncbi:putative transcriptional regulator YdeE [Paenibacillus castaneae]|uniref:GyrI-like domain-containing protein n=1 Tax=Paenibacillus castaneae TaxID=474957 RepID=UPI00141BD531|nr:GyrI-like domain-containing protein [Paenibacillus castaneae]NIK77804.1 putative transcriptional regulator YdeE [Paenibacillus castaneae]